MFIQSSSFAAGAITASVAVKGGLALLAVFTPMGLVGLLIGGAAIAAGAAAGAVVSDTLVADRAGAWYDEITDWLSSL